VRLVFVEGMAMRIEDGVACPDARRNLMCSHRSKCLSSFEVEVTWPILRLEKYKNSNVTRSTRHNDGGVTRAPTSMIIWSSAG
jgi:hypothetical protein